MLFRSYLSIYPNPVKDEFTVYGLQFIVGDEIKIVDVMGKEIFKTKLQTTSKNFKLTTSNIAKGIYFLKMKVNDKLITKKIMKE